MSSTAFTIDLDDPTDPVENSVSTVEQELQPSGSTEENAQDSDDNVGLAWQIEFTASANTSSKPKKQMPKFLRDREKARLEKISKESSKKTVQTSHDTKSPTRTLSETRRNETKSVTPSTRSRTPMPLKAKSVPEVSLAVRSPRTKDIRPSSSPTTRTQTSPKSSPAIKQPLLTVESPRRGQSSPTRTSSSNSSISLRSPRRTVSATPSLSPRKAKDIKRKQKSDKSVPPSTSESSYTSGSSGKSGRASSAQRQLPTMEIPTADVVDKRPLPTMAVHQQDIEQRKVLDLKRWYCMCHPQYSKSCGISSVVSCWNYLFSTLGNGSRPPITQEEALTLLGFKPPFGEIRFGPFTGNATCMRWFKQLCNYYGVCGQAYYFYKPVGKGKTFGLKPEVALHRLKDGLHDPCMAFVYHCLNHYFCPIGYEDVPKMAQDAYKFNLADEDVDTWILIGEPSRKQSSIHCKRWSDIVTDLSTKRPEFFNIRHTERGVQSKKTKRLGGNLHCIMAFKKLDDTSPDMFIGPEIPSEPQELQQSLSEVENLDSSDSDFPLSPKNSQNDKFLMGTDVPDADSEAIEVMNAVRQELGGKKIGQAIIIPTQDLVYESVDSPEVFGDEELSNNQANVLSVVDVTESEQQSLASVQFVSQGKHNLMSETANFETSIEDDYTKLYPSARLRSGTFVVEKSDSESSQTNPSSIRRSGTFTKGSNEPKPTIQTSSEDSDCQNVSSNHYQASPPSIRRSGTFTKESKESKPVIIRKTRPPSEYSSDQDSEQDLDNDKSSDAITQSGSFSELLSTLQVPGRSMPNFDETDTNVEPQSGSLLRRSGTFTKEKPDVIVTRAYESESSSSEEIEKVASKLHDKLELNTSYLTRSGTYTKQKPVDAQQCESDSSYEFEYLDGVDLNETLKAPTVESDEDASVEETLLLPSEQDSYLKRSGTYTKHKPFLDV